MFFFISQEVIDWILKSVLNIALLALGLLCVASALEEKLLDDPDLRGIKSLNRKFRNKANPGQKSKVPAKKEKPDQTEQQESEGSASTFEFAKLDEKYNNILKSSIAISALFQ
jgi:hypothetical protein